MKIAKKSAMRDSAEERGAFREIQNKKEEETVRKSSRKTKLPYRMIEGAWTSIDKFFFLALHPALENHIKKSSLSAEIVAEVNDMGNQEDVWLKRMLPVNCFNYIQCQKVLHFKMDGKVRLTDSDWENFLSNNSNVTELTIYGCENHITENEVRSMTRLMPQLNTLKLYHMKGENMGNDIIGAVNEYARNLKTMHIVYRHGYVGKQKVLSSPQKIRIVRYTAYAYKHVNPNNVPIGFHCVVGDEKEYANKVENDLTREELLNELADLEEIGNMREIFVRK